MAGDFNTDSRTEAAITTFSAIVSDTPIPVDNLGNSDTSINRDHPHDYVLDSYSMTNAFTPVVYPSNTFPNGLVFDSRVYTPLSDVPPVQVGDSDSANGMQHMAVVKDFLVPVQLASGALLAVTPVDSLSSLGHVGGPFSPSNQVYDLSNSGNSNLTWSASNSASWVTLSSTAGTIAPGSDVTVTVSINANANSLSANNYSDTVVFTNTTNGSGSTTRPVSLTVESTFPVIIANGWTLTTESCTPTNGVVDPGETVTVNLTVNNTGTANTTNLVATLLGTDDVTSPSDPQAYGIVSAGGAPVSESFSFTAGGTCGGAITAILALQDGVANLGTISYIIPLGISTNVFTQNFDSVAAPALPAGWTTSATGAQSNWVTSTTLADTAPNSAFSPDPSIVGINELDTPSVAINSSVASLTFRQNYSLAVSTTNNTIGYDGGVLEIAIGGGSYTDIVAAGGSFVSDGYNTTLSGDFGNPLAGRQAWSGSSGVFTTTVVNLPAAAAGQNIQLRWRCAAGNTPGSVTSSGTLAYWNFDTMSNVPTSAAPNLSVTPITTNNLSSGATFTFFAGNSGSATAASGFSTSAGPPTAAFGCFAFSITVTNGAQASLSKFSFDDRASGTGPTKFSVQISQQANFSTLLFDSGIQSAHTAFSTTPMESFTLSSSSLTGTIYFRIYGYQGSASSGTWRIDNLTVQGSVTSGSSTIGSGWYVDSVSIQDAFCCTNLANPLVADFIGTPTTGTAPLAVTFNDNSIGTVSNWFWDFGDSGTTNVTTSSVVHTYAAGVYNVMLVATGPAGVSTNIKAGYITALTPFQSWQIQYFGSTTNPAAAANVDADGDGQNNLAEFLAGTDPTNGASAFRITAITTQGTNVFISWTMGAGTTNALQVTSGDLVGGYATNGFINIFSVTNTVGTTTNYLDIGGATNVPVRYYRVRLVP